MALALNQDSSVVTELIDAGPISRLQLLVFAICFLMNALDGMDVLVISYAAPLLAQELGIAPAALGVVFSAGLVGMTCGAMFIAPYADHIGRRKIIQLSILLTGVGVFATGLASTIEVLALLRFVSGLGIGAMLASVATLAAEYAPNRSKNFILGCVLAGYPIGATLFGVMAAEVIPAFGWRSIFTVAGVATLMTLPLVSRYLPESLSILAIGRDDDALAKVNDVAQRMGRAPLTQLPTSDGAQEHGGVRRLFEDGLARSTVGLWLSFFMTFVVLYFLTSWIPKLASSAGLSLDLAIYAGAVFNLGAVLGIAISGLVSQRIGLRSTIALFLLLTAASMWIFGLAEGNDWILPLFGLIGFFLQGGFVGLYAVGARLYSARVRSTGVGWAIGAGRTGAIVGPLVGGLLIALELSIATNFRWFSIAAVAAGLFALLIRRDQLQH